MTRVNLLRQTGCAVRPRTSTIAVLAFIGLTVGGPCAWIHLSRLHKQEQRLKEEVRALRARVDGLQARHTELVDRALEVSRLHNRTAFVSILGALSEAMPQEVSVSQLTVSSPRTEAAAGVAMKTTVDVEGEVTSDGAIADLVARIEDGGLFEEIHLHNSRKSSNNERAPYVFRLSMQTADGRRTGGGP